MYDTLSVLYVSAAFCLARLHAILCVLARCGFEGQQRMNNLNSPMATPHSVHSADSVDK